MPLPEREQLDAIFETFQAELRTISLACDSANKKAAERYKEGGSTFPGNFGLWCFDPQYLETSVSI